MRAGPTRRSWCSSNYATPDIRKRCAQFGVDAVFDKSNEIDALIDFCIEQARAAPARLDEAATSSRLSADAARAQSISLFFSA